MTDTRPGELARIKELAGNDPYRVEMLVNIATLLERTEAHTQWMKDHDKSDSDKFAAGDARMARIEESVGGAKSSVSNLEVNSRYTLKEMIIGTLTLCGAVGALIYFIVWTIGNAGKGAP